MCSPLLIGCISLQSDVVQSALTWVANQRGYLSWPNYLLANTTPLLTTWISHHGSFEQLMTISKLLTLPLPPSIEDPRDDWTLSMGGTGVMLPATTWREDRAKAGIAGAAETESGAQLPLPWREAGRLAGNVPEEMSIGVVVRLCAT